MPVEIKIFGENAAQTLYELSELSNYLAPREAFHGTTAALQSSTAIAEQEISAVAARAKAEDRPVNEIVREETAAKRERGQPSPGKARRTKAEIAEDEAADALDAETIAQDSGQAQIDEPEPETAEEQADAVQDAADETAETEANGGLHPRERLRKALGALGMKAGVEAVRPGGLLGMTVDMVPAEDLEAAIAKLEAAKAGQIETKADAPAEPEAVPATKDDLMQAMLDYAEVFDGTRNPAEAKLAQVDAGEVFKKLFGEGVSKLSAVPADGYAKAIAGIKEAIQKNPFKRERKA